MKIASPAFLLLAIAACGGTGDSGDMPPDMQPDAAVDSPPPEPKPMFKAGESIGVNLAIDDAGIRDTYKSGSVEKPSYVSVSLTETSATTSCTVKIKPKFVAFGSSNASNRSFKTVIIDFAASTVLDDQCHFDDAWITSKLDEQFGHYEVGFAQARFAEDRPGLDVLLDADKTFSNSTASFTYAGAGTAMGMNADGTVTLTMVEPAPGTLVPALYKF